MPNSFCLALEHWCEIGRIDRAEVAGFSEPEVRAIESSLSVKLPPVYTEFLLFAGRGTGLPIGGPWLSVRSVSDFRLARTVAEKVLVHYKSEFVLSPTMFVMDCDLDEEREFHFFDTSVVDSPLWNFFESDPMPLRPLPKKMADSLSAYFDNVVLSAERFWDRFAR